MQYEMLNDICKVSALQATTALSRFLNTPVGVNIKPVKTDKINELLLSVNKDETLISLFQAIKGDVQGGSFILYPKETALNICDILFGRTRGSTKAIDEDEESALSEIANIVIGNFLTSFAQFMQVDSLMHHSAKFSTGTYDNIFTKKLPHLAKELKEEVVVLVSFGLEHVHLQGYVILIFEKEKINTLLLDLHDVSK